MCVAGAANESDGGQTGCSKENPKGYGTRPWQGHAGILGDGCNAFRQRTASNISKRAGNPPELNRQDAGEKHHCNTRDTLSADAFAVQAARLERPGTGEREALKKSPPI